MLVSVVIPTYNRDKLVKEAIESALSQTYKNIEVIVIDDGSTDNTKQELAGFGDRIKYIRTERIGPGKARNLGISKAKGDYIAFLDSDDLWMDFKIDLQVKILNRFPKIGFLCTNFKIFFDDGKEIPDGLSMWNTNDIPWENIYKNKFSFKSLNIENSINFEDFDIYQGNLYLPLLFDVLVMPSSSMVRASILDADTKFAEGVFVYEDWEFFTTLSKKSDNLFLNLETTLNRGHEDEVRLTSRPIPYKLQRRLEMLDRQWAADEQLTQSNQNEVTQVKSGLLASLTRSLLIHGNNKEAGQSFEQFKKIRNNNFKFEFFYLFILIKIPIITLILRAIRSLILGVKR